jgi:hypothetical protein
MLNIKHFTPVKQSPHNHKSQPEKIRIIRFKASLKKSAQNSVASASKIFNEVLNCSTKNTLPNSFIRKSEYKNINNIKKRKTI